VAAEVSRDLPGGFLVAAGQKEILTAGREVRRQRAADVAVPTIATVLSELVT
jgi:hypothetical protein